MSTYPHAAENSTATTTTDRKHSREDALTERQFVQLVEATREMGDPYAFEARLCCYLCGKLGLRAGEATHLRSDWIDWHDRMIVVPEHAECTKGQDDSVCGYCREMAERRLRTNNLTRGEAADAVRQELGEDVDQAVVERVAIERMGDVNITYAQAIAERWQPKTPNSVRSIPFDFDVRTQLAIEAFDERYDTFPKSRCTVNRRIDQAAEAAGLEVDVYPHALRATAASFHASRGVSPYSLMAIMGWSDIDTARSYIQASESTAAKEIRSKHR